MFPSLLRRWRRSSELRHTASRVAQAAPRLPVTEPCPAHSIRLQSHRGERGSPPAPHECGPQADPGEERQEPAGAPQTGSEPGPSGTSRSSAMKHPDPSDDSCHPALPFPGQQLGLQRWDRPSCPEDRGGVGHTPGPLPEEGLSGHRKPPGPAEFPGPQLIKKPLIQGSPLNSLNSCLLKKTSVLQ